VFLKSLPQTAKKQPRTVTKKSNMEQSSDLTELPKDILSLIRQNLDLSSTVSMCLVNKQFLNFLQQSSFWENIYFQFFCQYWGKKDRMGISVTDWFDVVKDSYKRRTSIVIIYAYSRAYETGTPGMYLNTATKNLTKSGFSVLPFAIHQPDMTNKDLSLLKCSLNRAGAVLFFF